MAVQDNFRRFAMRVEAMSQQGEKWVDVDAVGEHLGLSSFESRRLADLLSDEGWVTTLEVAGLVKLRLVKRGFDEVAKLRWPKWRRWLHTNTVIGGAIAGGVVAVLVNLLVEFLKRRFWPV